MKVCSKCGQQYLDDFSFCGKCGIPLTDLVEARVCPSCHRNFGDQQISFCPYCGVGLINQAQNSATVTPNINYNSASNMQMGNPAIRKNEHSFFSRENLLTADGRRGRLTYFLLNGCWGAIYGFLSSFMNSVFRNPDINLIINLILMGVFSYLMYCNAAKRFHDLDRPTSWAAIFVIVPLFISLLNQWYGFIVGVLANIYPLFFKGTEGPNQYGEDPLQEA